MFLHHRKVLYLFKAKGTSGREGQQGLVQQRPRGRRDQTNPTRRQMRLDAVKAEADRKAQQKTNTEQGLPAFYESQPLTGHVDGDQVYLDNEHDSSSQSRIAGQGHSGYVQGSPGGRAIDDYYAGPSQTSGSNIYPPSRREPSAYAPSTYSTSATQSPSTATLATTTSQLRCISLRGIAILRHLRFRGNMRKTLMHRRASMDITSVAHHVSAACKILFHDVDFFLQIIQL